MDNSLSRVSTNGSNHEQITDGGPVSAIYSASSVGSSKATSPTSANPPRLGPRAPSAHSLLGGGNPAELRRKPHTETDKTNTERASISMPPPASKPKSERRLSASLNAYQNARKSEDAPRSSPTSIRSADDKRSPINGPSALASTTATDSIHVTTASTGTASTPGLPVLSPPTVAAQPPNDLDIVSANSSSQVASSGATKAETPSTLKPEDSGTLPTRAPRNNNPRSISSSRRLSTPSQKSMDVPENTGRKLVGTIGVCALDVKARSKPSRQILTRLQADGEFEVVVFGDKAILDEEVTNWPICDFLIAFFSDGFPLAKAESYVKLRRPWVVNDLPMQRVLWDRRICLKILDQMQVPTPKRLEVNRDGGPRVDSAELASHLRKVSGVLLSGPSGVGGDVTPPTSIEMPDDDTLIVDGKVIKKPFVEKPVSGEDHSVWIFLSTAEGGGGRKLFRKINNKSSEFDKTLTTPRCITEPGGSFIYEQFLKTENAEDVKAYTVGADYCHAETRKSPVVDGLVKRNLHGKEVRYVTQLTEKEREIASRVSRGFGQRICGFDLLRANGQSYVIDVNGWSFVKDNEDYYNDCAMILKTMFYNEKAKRDSIADDASSQDGHGEAATSANRRETASSASGQHSHRQALKGIFKSPSISKLSSHLPSRHHQHGTASPKSSSMTTPISSPPTMDRPVAQINPGTKIPEPESLLPPPSMPQATVSDSILDSPTLLDGSATSEPAPMPNSKHSWKLKGVVAVIRHADRTPKQKIKFTAHQSSQAFVPLLAGHQEEVLLKGEAALARLEAAVKTAQREGLDDEDKLRNLRNALARKRSHPATKVQIKPMFRKRRPEELLPEATTPSAEVSIPEHAEAQIPQSPLSPAPNDELKQTTSRKDSMSGPTFSRYAAQENDLVLDKIQLVMKCDFKLLNRKVLDDVRIFTSSENRVKTSASIFAAAFLGRPSVSEDEITVSKTLLDDSNAAKDTMDKVKKQLKHLLREGNSIPNEFAWPTDVPEPAVVMQRVIDLMRFHRKVLRYNFKKLEGGAAASLAAINAFDSKAGAGQRQPIDINSIQSRWCTGESEFMFKERWEKLFSEFCDTDKADPSKVSELYDSLKYDALHNKAFAEWVFTPSQTVIDEEMALDAATTSQLASPESEKEEPVPGVDRQGTSTTLSPNDKHSFAQKMGFRRRSVLAQPPSTPPLTIDSADSQYFKLFQGSSDKKEKLDSRLGRLRELYRLAKILFDFIGPQEYGITPAQKLEIGLLTSLPLLREIVGDLEELQATGDAKSFIYFTKESHIYTLLNCIMEGGLHTKIKRAAIPELDYLSNICFELYESKDSSTLESAYSIRISISPGCHAFDVFNITLDSKHSIGSAARRSLTDHSPWKDVIETMKSRFDVVELPKSFLAINVSAQHEEDAKGAGEMLQEEDSQVNGSPRTGEAAMTDE